jgi:hypothetical protein
MSNIEQGISNDEGNPVPGCVRRSLWRRLETAGWVFLFRADGISTVFRSSLLYS